MSDLPPGWEWATLDDLAAPEPRPITDGPFGSNLKTAHYVDSGPRVIRLQNIGFGDFIDEHAHITEDHFDGLRAYEACGGDLVIASLGQDLPRSCIIPDTVGPAIVKADCIRVRLHPEINARFVNYALQRPALRHSVREHIHGVGRPRLGMAGIRELPVPMPPRSEQERIVATLEEYCSRLDAADAALRSTELRLRRLKAAVVEQATTGDWETRRLGEVLISLRNGCFVSRPDPKPPGLPIYRISAVRPLALDTNDIRYAPETLARAEDFVVQTGDLLFTRYSGNPAYVGACAVVPPEGAGRLHPDKLIRGVIDPRLVVAEWIAIAMASIAGRREVERRMKTTAGQVGIAGSQLKSVPLPIPPLHVQEAQVAALKARLASISRFERLLGGRLTKRSTTLRQSLLATAFSGTLAPQDPSDEPASVLLERIRAERAAAKPARKPRRKTTMS